MYKLILMLFKGLKMQEITLISLNAAISDAVFQKASVIILSNFSSSARMGTVKFLVK